ncbi:hypothetical protein [Pontibacter sp. H249]|uniref:hypothetical protein n=1 Tax=Pontibacter sp. H249 TaxID=3133420 RepID=UPI0030C521CE
MKQVLLMPLLLCAFSGAGALESAVTCKAQVDMFSAFSSQIAPQDTVKVSYVREDDPKTKKKARVKTTRVNFKRDVQRAALSKQSTEGNQVDIIVMQSGQIVRNLEDLQLVGNSGNQLSNNRFIGFENISVPFEGSIRFKATNKLGTVSYDREVRFTVMEEGKWVLRIDL